MCVCDRKLIVHIFTFYIYSQQLDDIRINTIFHGQLQVIHLLENIDYSIENNHH